MKNAVKAFLHRGLMFGGFGPVILGIIYAILEKTVADFTLDGTQVLITIVSIYLLAFVHAGASVFNQMEHWSVPKSLFWHFTVLYVAYVSCYLVNSWIPFDPNVILIFTAIFAAVYLVVWITVFVTVKLISRKLNKTLI